MRYTANPVQVEAHRISAVGERNTLGNTLLALENGESVVATGEMTARYAPVAGDYWVVQEDGYVYLNPAAVFERKYSPDAETSLMAKAS